MKINVIRIGNSKGIRIPKPLLEECALRDAVEVELRDGALLIRPARRSRQGWDESFRRMASRGDDALLDAESAALREWDHAEWRW